MESQKLTIGTLAARTQCTVPTIRYYEEIGLLPPAPRGTNGRRYYREADHTRLLFIKRCRDFGFPIDQVRDLVSMFEDGDRSCIELRDVAQDHLTQVRAKIAEMRQLEESLQAFVQSCNESCLGRATRDCTIIGGLSSQSSANRARSCCSGSGEGVGESSSEFVEVRRR